jgi:CBS domain-containing membrane protein
MNPLRAVWLRLKPEPSGVNATEQLRSAVAGALAVLFVGWASSALLNTAPFVVASVGASAVLVFAVPASPFAQPWSVVGGYLMSAAAGVAAAQWLPGSNLIPATALAAGLAIFGMLALRCLHPPGGAVALFAVLGGEPVRALGWQFVATPVLANAVLLVAVALLVNNLLPGRHYPRRLVEELERGPDLDADQRDRLGLRRQDLHAALRGYGRLVDVGDEDLDEIVEQAERLAFRRAFGELACADIMSRVPITVQSVTSLLEAWRLLRRHRLTTLLVADSLGRVTGKVSLDDFVRAAKAGTARGLRQRLFALLRRNFARDASVGSIMRRELMTVRPEAHVAELVAPMSRGEHEVAVTEADGRLVGIVTQSDLIAALYQSRLAGN